MMFKIFLVPDRRRAWGKTRHPPVSGVPPEGTGTHLAAGVAGLARRIRFGMSPQFCVPEKLTLALMGLLLLALAAGCRTWGRPLPKVSLQEPGWTLREGQAVWHLPKSSREIAGEVLLASRPDGRAFIQFSKPPFPLVVGQLTTNRWDVEFPPQKRRYAGPGKPPKRLIWLQLPRVLSGQPAPKGWIWRENAEGWRLENPAQGEALEGYFEP